MYVCIVAYKDTQFVVGVVEAKMEAYRTEFGRTPTVRAAATVTRNLCYANKDQLSAGIVCAGWDAREGGAVFSIPQVNKRRRDDSTHTLRERERGA